MGSGKSFKGGFKGVWDSAVSKLNKDSESLGTDGVDYQNDSFMDSIKARKKGIKMPCLFIYGEVFDPEIHISPDEEVCSFGAREYPSSAHLGTWMDGSVPCGNGIIDRIENHPDSLTDEEMCSVRRGEECIKPTSCAAFGCNKPM